MGVLVFFLFHLAPVQSGDQSVGHGVVVGHQPSCDHIQPVMIMAWQLLMGV